MQQKRSSFPPLCRYIYHIKCNLPLFLLTDPYNAVIKLFLVIQKAV